MATPQDVYSDSRFQALSPAEKITVLQRIDPNFARLSPADQRAVVNYRASQDASATADRAAVASRKPGAQVPDVSTAGGVARQFAGGVGETFNPLNIYTGLREGIREAATSKDPLAQMARGYFGPAGIPAAAIALPATHGILNALQWYKDAFAPKWAGGGKIPYAYEQMLTAAPEALGQGSAQAAMMRGPIETLARTEPVNALARGVGLSPAPPVSAPGTVLGIMNRAQRTMNRIERNYRTVLVDADPVNDIARRALLTSQRGFTLPKAIRDYVNFIRSGQPMTFAVARDFEKAFGAKVRWEGESDVMNGYMKQMDNALSEQNAAALENDTAGAGQQYLQTKAQFAKGKTASRVAKNIGQGVGHAIGGAAGYEALGEFGHPFVGLGAGGAAGGWLGRLAGPAAMRAVTGAPYPLTRLPGAAVSPFTQPFTQPQQEEDINAKVIRSVAQPSAGGNQ